MNNAEYLAFRKRIQAEEGNSPPDDVAVSEILKTLAAWASEPHDLVCQGLPQCRHERAKQAIVEVNNAVASCQKDHEEAEKQLVEQLQASHE